MNVADASPTLLLVTDSQFTGTTLRRALRDKGYDVWLKTSPDSAIAQLERALPALLLLDGELRSDGAITVERATRRICPDVPVVALLPEHDARAIASRLRAKRALRKPVDLAALLRTLDLLLNRSSAADAPRSGILRTRGNATRAPEPPLSRAARGAAPQPPTTRGAAPAPASRALRKRHADAPASAASRAVHPAPPAPLSRALRKAASASRPVRSEGDPDDPSPEQAPRSHALERRRTLDLMRASDLSFGSDPHHTPLPAPHDSGARWPARGVPSSDAAWPARDLRPVRVLASGGGDGDDPLSRLPRLPQAPTLDADPSPGAMPFQANLSMMSAASNKVRTIVHMMGSLKATPLPALLYKVFANEMTGQFQIVAGQEEHIIYLRNGEPVYAASPSAATSLARVVADMRLVPNGPLNALAQDNPSDEALQRALIEEGLVTPPDMYRALDRQVYERVLNCFTLTDGIYAIIPSNDWLATTPSYPQNPIQLIYRGVLRFYPPNTIAAKLHDQTARYVVRTEKFDAFLPFFPATEGHAAMIPRIDGLHTVQDLSVQAGGGVMELLTLIWALQLADMVEFADAPSSEPRRSPSKPKLPSRTPAFTAHAPAGLPPAALPPARSSSPAPASAPPQRPAPSSPAEPARGVTAGINLTLGGEAPSEDPSDDAAGTPTLKLRAPVRPPEPMATRMIRGAARVHSAVEVSINLPPRADAPLQRSQQEDTRELAARGGEAAEESGEVFIETPTVILQAIPEAPPTPPSGHRVAPPPAPTRPPAPTPPPAPTRPPLASSERPSSSSSIAARPPAAPSRPAPLHPSALRPSSSSSMSAVPGVERPSAPSSTPAQPAPGPLSDDAPSSAADSDAHARPEGAQPAARWTNPNVPRPASIRRARPSSIRRSGRREDAPAPVRPEPAPPTQPAKPRPNVLERASARASQRGTPNAIRRTLSPIQERVPAPRSRPEPASGNDATPPPAAAAPTHRPPPRAAGPSDEAPRPQPSGSLRARTQGRIQRPGRPHPHPGAAPRGRAGGPPSPGNPDIIAQAHSGAPAGHDDPEARANDLLERAKSAAEGAKWKVAYRALKNARELAPQNAGVLTWLAWVTYQLPYDDRDRQYRICRDQLQAALAIDPRQSEAYYFTGCMAEEHFDIETAAESYARAVKLDPAHAQARARLEALRKHDAQNPNKGDGTAKKMFNRLMDWLDE